MTTPTELAIQAIATRKTLHFMYDDRQRIVEVHAVGVGGKGELIRGWQVAGESSRPLPCWVLFTVAKITDATLESLPMSGGPREGYQMNDSAMITIIAQLPARSEV